MSRDASSDHVPAADGDAEEAGEPSPYMLVLDAGSSGTRAHVFEFQVGKTTEFDAGLLPVSVKKHKPGLSSCADGTTAQRKKCGEERISALLGEVAEKLFDEDNKAKPKTYLLATAGLRMLDHHVAEEVLAGAEAGIRASGFRNAIAPRVASGTDEAVYDWLAVNLAGSDLVRSRGNPTTLGVIDLGGASMQVAFVVEGRDFPIGYAPLQLPRALGDHQLYAMSRLGFGLNVAFDKMVDNPRHPCSLLGGNGDFHACMKKANEFVALYRQEHRVVHIDPPSDMKFVLLDNFYKAVAHVLFGVADHITNLGVIITSCETLPFECGHAYSPTLRQLFLAGQAICKAKWSEVSALAGGSSGVSEDKLRKVCFATAYAVTILTNVQNFEFDERRLYIPNRLGHFDASWAYGAAAYYAIREHSAPSPFFGH